MMCFHRRVATITRGEALSVSTRTLPQEADVTEKVSSRRQETFVVRCRNEATPRSSLNKAAIMLVGQTLAEHGSPTACTRDEIRDAFAYLTSPRVHQETWTNDDRIAIVIRAYP